MEDMYDVISMKTILENTTSNAFQGKYAENSHFVEHLLDYTIHMFLGRFGSATGFLRC